MTLVTLPENNSPNFSDDDLDIQTPYLSKQNPAMPAVFAPGAQ